MFNIRTFFIFCLIWVCIHVSSEAQDLERKKLLVDDFKAENVPRWENIDSVLIRFKDFTNFQLTTIVCFANKLKISTDGLQSLEKEIVNVDTLNVMQNYLDVFYIQQKESIEAKRKWSYLGPVVADYSILNIEIFYKEGKSEMFNRTLGEEHYIVTYNAKFERFIKLLEAIIKSE